MKFAVPKESLRNEHRVGLTPFAVSRLVAAGHQVFVEHDAGRDSHFADGDYTQAGAQVVYRPDEVYGRADVICRVGPLSPGDAERIRPNTTVCGFLSLAMSSQEIARQLQKKKATVIGYELIEDVAGHRPLLTLASEIAGRLVVHIAAHLLQSNSGGRGLLLGGIAGVSPAQVVVLGGGTVGRVAAEGLLQAGAQVSLLDNDVERLREIVDRAPHINTALATPRHVARFTRFADVLIGAVFIPGGRVPWLVTEEMVCDMKPGSVILDISIDQGGCVETSRPTSLDNPTYTVHGVTHYCVPNIAANVPRVSSRALSMGAIRYLEQIGEHGLDSALHDSHGLASGLYLYRGQTVNELAAAALGLTFPHRAVGDMVSDQLREGEE